MEDAVLGREPLPEALGEFGDRFGDLAQRRDVDGDDVQAVVQVFAEGALAAHLAQVAVGGGDDPDVGPHRSLAAQRIELAFLDHAQQLHLGVQGHVADLVEEDRTAVGQLELALASLGTGAGEGAGLVAEELGLDQVLVDRAAVQPDEGAVAAPAAVVDALAEDLLADARFSAEQHGRVGARGPDRGFLGVFDQRRRGEDAVEGVFGVRACRLDLAHPLQLVLEALDPSGQLVGLLDILVADHADRADAGLAVEQGNARHHRRPVVDVLEGVVLGHAGPGHDVHPAVLDDLGDMPTDDVLGADLVVFLEAGVDVDDPAAGVDDHQRQGDVVDEHALELDQMGLVGLHGFQLIHRITPSPPSSPLS